MSNQPEIGLETQHAVESVTATGKKEIKQNCRFFKSRSGCKAGDQCRFSHVRPRAKGVQNEDASASAPLSTSKPLAETSNEATEGASARKYMPPSVDRSRVVSRPVSKVQVDDPREFQVGQLRRRFTPREEDVNGGTIFHLKLAPSDPDFPFEIEHVSCSLTVPFTYPSSGRPSIRVTNPELQRGFQLNIERGFQELAVGFPDATLFGLFNRLDKELEALLSKEMAETVNFKFVKPVKQEPPRPVTPPVAPVLTRQDQQQIVVPVFQPAFSSEQKLKAQTKRQSDVRQVVARLGRLNGFVQHTDGVTFTIPFQPLKKNALPSSLQRQSSVRLIVPEMYNLHHPRIEFHGNNAPEARQVEDGFKERAILYPDTTLLAQVNYLAQHAHTMAVIKDTPAPPTAPVMVDPTPELQTDPEASPSHAHVQSDDMPDKSHVQFIPRPPEWGGEAGEEQDWSSDESVSNGDEDGLNDDDEDSSEDDKAVASTAPSMPAEKGIMLSFPSIELHSIELLELVSLNVTVKCDRCKDITEILRLRNNITGEHTGMKDESCKKCANTLAAGWRQDMVHANSSRAGYLDLDGCTVVDMLPSNFIPTCSECSTPYPAPGVAAVRGDAAMAICRECHKKMTFRIPETKFLHVSAAAVRATQGPVRKKIKENLGIVAGQELPQRGRCKHYTKSYRWFRFSCCQRVFPCDRCHDEASDHPEEHANRMLCGFCSREQNYSPDQCHFCHNSLIKRRGQGFWEGGKGTRDPTKMSRKDPRKYKRRPGTKPKA